MDPKGKLDIESYLLCDRELWHARVEKRKPVSVVRRTSVSHLIYLIHAMHGNSGVASPLALRRERFNWPSMSQNVRE